MRRNKRLKLKTQIEIIAEAEAQILVRLTKIETYRNEVDALQKFVDSFRAIGESEQLSPAVEQEDEINSMYPDYPYAGSLLEKYRYLEDKYLRVWPKKEMEQLIRQIEGNRQASRTLRNADQRIHAYVRNRELINLKYHNSRKYSFYTTRPEWIDRRTEDGKTVNRLLPEHAPDSKLISHLSEEQLKPENIEWKGLM